MKGNDQNNSQNANSKNTPNKNGSQNAERK